MKFHILTLDKLALNSKQALKVHTAMGLRLPNYSSVWLIGLVFLIVLVVQKTLAYCRLRHFRGPPGTGLTDLFHSKEMIGPRLHEWYENVNEKYGKTPHKIIS